jgi:hypothetical protein
MNPLSVWIPTTSSMEAISKGAGVLKVGRAVVQSLEAKFVCVCLDSLSLSHDVAPCRVLGTVILVGLCRGCTAVCTTL